MKPLRSICTSEDRYHNTKAWILRYNLRFHVETTSIRMCNVQKNGNTRENVDYPNILLFNFRVLLGGNLVAWLGKATGRVFYRIKSITWPTGVEMGQYRPIQWQSHTGCPKRLTRLILCTLVSTVLFYLLIPPAIILQLYRLSVKSTKVFCETYNLQMLQEQKWWSKK